ncbi:MAG TPA: tetratricopeptide repeat protein [Thermoanaerobaculia bacterium]|jgi:tetratricopeptide (TPR) repeat protein
MMHYDDEALFQYAEGTSPIAREVEAHVAGCETCARELGGHREIVHVLRTSDVWDESSAPAAPRKFVVDITAFAERARQEESEAKRLCDEILTGPSSWWQQRLRQAENVYTAGMVKELLERMSDLIETSPSKALEVTTMAIEIANALDLVSYPCDYALKLRAQAYRDYAYVLRFIGRYPDALEAADRSKRLFDQVPLPEYDLARLAVVRASILAELDRDDEAIALTREAAVTFERFGDRVRQLNALLTVGVVLFERGTLDEALTVWQQIVNDPDLESVSRVRVIHNMGVAYSRLGQPTIAAEHLHRALAEFDLLGMDTERTRSRHVLAQTLVTIGKVREAIPLFRECWREFEQLDMVSDAAQAALNLAEALLIVGDAAEVPSICRDVVARFQRAGMTSRAMTALSFLREAVAIGEATPSLVRHVYAFLRKLPDERPRLHAPASGSVGE